VRAAYLVGCDRRHERVRNELGIGLRGEGNLLQAAPGVYAATISTVGIPIGNGPGKGAITDVADDRDVPDHADSRGTDLHSIVDRTRTWRDSSSGPSACP